MDNQSNNKGKWFIEQLNLYQAANSDNESIKKNFIIRGNEFELIINSLKDKNEKDPLQHELILGRRGSGKSTLLKRIQIEIEETPEFSSKYIAVNLAEEQAGIYRLFDLWEEVIEELISKLNLEIKLKDYKEFKLEQEFTRYLYQVIHEICLKEKKRIVLLLDNFDRIVENFTDDGNLLRETLINFNDIEIVAGSTRMDEHFWQYDKPFYEFFRRHRLEALSSDEINMLINHWSETLQIPELKDFVKSNRGKIENIRILTDGLPRTLQLFIQMLLQNPQLYGYDYLRKVMDNVTPLYQERLNYLPPQLRKIISEMAFIWEACTTRQLVEKCRMESKLISANLKTLIDKGIVDKLETSKRNHLYRISERFFNMWLIITQGNPEQKRKAKWLSIFLENWYDANDFKKLTDEHIHNLKDNKLGFNQALVFSKALCQCKYISTLERDTIIELTENLNGKKANKSLLELPKKYSIIEQEVFQLIDKNEFEKALKLVEEIENEKDGEKYVLLTDVYFYKKDYKNCEKYLLLAIKNGQINSLYNLGFLYESLKKYKLAEKYFLKAIKVGDKNSLNNLASMYSDMNENEKSKKYYLEAIDKGIIMAHNNIAILYLNQNTKKVESLQNIKKFNQLSPDSKSIYLEILISVWNGIFDDIELRIISVISGNLESNETLDLDAFLTGLLIHQQKMLVLKLFLNEKIGEELQDKYSVLYYVTLLLNNSKEENLELKIPPEIQSTIDQVILEINERQEFYGYQTNTKNT